MNVCLVSIPTRNELHVYMTKVHVYLHMVHIYLSKVNIHQPILRMYLTYVRCYICIWFIHRYTSISITNIHYRGPYLPDHKPCLPIYLHGQWHCVYLHVVCMLALSPYQHEQSYGPHIPVHNPRLPQYICLSWCPLLMPACPLPRSHIYLSIQSQLCMFVSLLSPVHMLCIQSVYGHWTSRYGHWTGWY